MKRIIILGFSILTAIFVFWCWIVWYNFDDLNSIPRVFLFVIIPPLIIWTLLKIAFRKNSNPLKLQWITLILLTASIMSQSVTLYTTIYDGNHLYSVQWAREQRRIEHAVKEWIKDNSAFPGTYRSIYFSGFIQKTDPFIDKGYTIRPIRYYYLSKDSSDIKAIRSLKSAYYGITHKYLLQNTSGDIDTATTYFQLTPMMEVESMENTNFNSGSWESEYGNEARQ